MFIAFSTVLGGLALFLYGVESCRQSFRQIDGWLQKTLFGLVKGCFKPFFFGTLMTLLSQSSTVATSLAIGFVDIGMMRLGEAILAMSGASFGGGLVILLISLNVVQLGPVLFFVGMLVTRFAKNSSTQNHGRVLQGVAFIFIGMLMIQKGVVPIVAMPGTRDLILWGSGNFFLMGFIAFALTSVIQNNTAVVAVAMSIAEAGLISDISGMAIVLGAHVGSTTIILLSGLSGKLNSRRLGVVTVVYKLLGALLFLPLIPVVLAYSRDFGLSVAPSLVVCQIALATANALFVTPFYAQLEKLSELVFPSMGNPGEPAYLNKDLAEFPPIALGLLSHEMTRLANFTEAFLQILFSLKDEQWRLPRLRANLKELCGECTAYFSAIPLPQKEPRLRRKYIVLFMALSSIEDIVNHIDRDLMPAWTPRSSRNSFLRPLTNELLTVVRLAFRFFVVGDEAIEKRARDEIAAFWVLESRLRYTMTYDETEISVDGTAWNILNAFSKIINASRRMLEKISAPSESVIKE